ncbi:hypothetical protein IMG5_185620 [Ichthyophthirius multifiliis]|uniref:3-hydroxyisobutyrate dehydrogenase n=1 Tax=Ichthyophthirius multifiliis TaxID=5932 RepID=G0R3J0_ICHMU|nr:hypothetical protein IMG5_185620 [Ichthyophthirius multifiliis]EGR27979.1 hypothetical protein IMG5_185620 [Ichthyophthirius multifiliis]|eukprot:XP_004027324.1 hypothetical protein IMG5_185620 [Ichthyophthirius multifiliis]
MRKFLRTIKPQDLRIETIGFIGLGNMGGPMALNLQKKGNYEVIAYDVSQEQLNKYQKEGLKTCTTLKELSKKANKFITMLPNSSHVQTVCEGPEGLFAQSEKGSLIIDSSTISFQSALNLYKSALQNSKKYIDTPVSGGVGAATAGTLTFMVGAENIQIFNECKNLLQFMGKNIINCEKPGAGQIAKACNNMALAIQMIATSEAISLGVKLGIDPKILSNIINTSSGRCWSSEVYNPCPGIMENVPSSKNYEGGFATELMIKDLGLAVEAAKQVNADTPLGIHAKYIYEQIIKSGLNRKDFSVVYQLITQNKIK